MYYLKGPVITFGIVFPAFFYLAFAAGHDAPVEAMVPGIAAMALFFTASAVGPLVTPWERQARTFERLLTSPASLSAILAGDVGAGAAFGSALALLPLGASLLLTSAELHAPLALAAGWLLGALAFSLLGVLMAAPATDTPSQVMMLSKSERPRHGFPHTHERNRECASRRHHRDGRALGVPRRGVTPLRSWHARWSIRVTAAGFGQATSTFGEPRAGPRGASAVLRRRPAAEALLDPGAARRDHVPRATKFEPGRDFDGD